MGNGTGKNWKKMVVKYIQGLWKVSLLFRVTFLWCCFQSKPSIRFSHPTKSPYPLIIWEIWSLQMNGVRLEIAMEWTVLITSWVEDV